MNHPIIQTQSVSPSSSEIGINRQLRQIYDTPHLTPREVKRLFIPIVRERVLKQDIKFAQAQYALQSAALTVEDVTDVVKVFVDDQIKQSTKAVKEYSKLQEKAQTVTASQVFAIESHNEDGVEVLTVEEPVDLMPILDQYQPSTGNDYNAALAGFSADLAQQLMGTIEVHQTFAETATAVDAIVHEALGSTDGSFGSSLLILAAQAAEDAGLQAEDTEIGRQSKAELRRLYPVSASARRRMMEGVQQYVVKIARTYLGRGVILDDLIQEGNIGLMKAIDKFDPARGYAFLTYANDWIHQAMGRACTNNGSLEKYQMRIPCHMYMAIGRVQKHWYSLCEDLQRDPTPEEIAQRCSISVTSAKTALEVLSRSSFSLDAQSKLADSDSTVGDFIPDDTAVDPLVAALRSDQQGLVRRAYNQLTDEEKQVLSMRHDLMDRGKPYTQEAVCRALDIKKSRMLNLERRALNKLQASLEMQSALGTADDIV